MGAFNAPKLGQRRLAQADRALHHCMRCSGSPANPQDLAEWPELVPVLVLRRISGRLWPD